MDRGEEYTIEDVNGLKFVRFTHIHNTGRFMHGVSTRIGGVSPAPFASLNLAFTSEDDEENMEENRRRMMAVLGMESAVVRHYIRLVHGVVVIEVPEDEPIDYPVAADGVVTALRGVPVSATYADCVPIILADPVKRACGVLHAGWRSAFGRIARHGVEMMKSCFGSNPSDMLAGVGPGIGRCCFEVGGEVSDAFFDKFSLWKDLMEASSNNGKYRIDLTGLNRRILMDSGIAVKNVVSVDMCTKCRGDLFFSYRREGALSGRMLAVIANR